MQCSVFSSCSTLGYYTFGNCWVRQKTFTVFLDYPVTLKLNIRPGGSFRFYYIHMIKVHFFDQFSQAPTQKQEQRVEECLVELQFLHNQVQVAPPPEAKLNQEAFTSYCCFSTKRRGKITTKAKAKPNSGYLDTFLFSPTHMPRTPCSHPFIT